MTWTRAVGSSIFVVDVVIDGLRTCQLHLFLLNWPTFILISLASLSPKLTCAGIVDRLLLGLKSLGAVTLLVQVQVLSAITS